MASESSYHAEVTATVPGTKTGLFGAVSLSTTASPSSPACCPVRWGDRPLFWETPELESFVWVEKCVSELRGARVSPFQVQRCFFQLAQSLPVPALCVPEWPSGWALGTNENHVSDLLQHLSEMELASAEPPCIPVFWEKVILLSQDIWEDEIKF